MQPPALMAIQINSHRRNFLQLDFGIFCKYHTGRCARVQVQSPSAVRIEQLGQDRPRFLKEVNLSQVPIGRKGNLPLKLIGRFVKYTHKYIDQYIYCNSAMKFVQFLYFSFASKNIPPNRCDLLIFDTFEKETGDLF